MRQTETVLLADDDPDDRALIKDAFEEVVAGAELHCVKDGQELLDYVRGQGAYSNKNVPAPALILLDLNMPKKDGRQVLRELKADAKLKGIPVVIFTTSSSEDDVRASYETGASSFIVKPSGYNTLLELLERLRKYWFETTVLPQW